MRYNNLLNEIKGKEFYRQAGEGKCSNLMLPLKAIYTMKDVYGINFPWCIGIIHSSYGEWWWDKNGMKEVAAWFLEQQKKDPRFITGIEKNWQHARKELKECIDDIRKRPEKPLAQFKELTQKAEEAWKHVIFIDAFDVNGEEMLKKEAGDDVTALTVPYEFSYVQRHELSLMKIAHALKQGKNVQKQLKEHTQAFYWYKNSYAVVEELNEKYFLEEVKKIVKQSDNEIQKEIDKIINEMKERQHKCDTLVAKVPKNVQNIIHFFRKLSDLRDQRKATHVELIVWVKKLIEQIVPNVPENLGQFIVYDEIDKAYDPLFINKLKEREKSGVLAGVTASHGFFMISGKGVQKVAQLFHETTSVQQITGRVAYAGKVQGIVKIVNTSADFKKFMDGEILVAPMTRPDYLPLMKKAAAFITDEGGITSHAAIVARELKKPCIIGTQTATKVLKDNDVVEVDATNGTVKILK